jgi:pimeloyl-ACP methyl ester carboxylesterase
MKQSLSNSIGRTQPASLRWPFTKAWRALAMLLAVCLTGCVSPGPIGSANRPNVIVMRGTGGYFPNLAEFEERLLLEGTCPTVAYPDAEGAIAERIVGGRNQGRWTGPLVIVGYSAGANAALSLSDRLGARGIEVDKLVLVEATESRRVPQNVHSCLNIYKSQPWGEYVPFLVGRPLEAAGAPTDLVNYDVREYNDGRFDWENHLTLAANPHVQDLIIDEVVEAIHPADKSDESLPRAESAGEHDDDHGGAGRASGVEGIAPPATE